MPERRVGGDERDALFAKLGPKDCNAVGCVRDAELVVALVQLFAVQESDTLVTVAMEAAFSKLLGCKSIAVSYTWDRRKSAKLRQDKDVHVVRLGAMD